MLENVNTIILAGTLLHMAEVIKCHLLYLMQAGAIISHGANMDRSNSSCF